MTNGDSPAPHVAASRARRARRRVARRATRARCPTSATPELRACGPRFLGAPVGAAGRARRGARGRPRGRLRPVVRGRFYGELQIAEILARLAALRVARRARDALSSRRAPRHRALWRPGRAARRQLRSLPAGGRGHPHRRRAAPSPSEAWASAARARPGRPPRRHRGGPLPELRFLPEAFDGWAASSRGRAGSRSPSAGSRRGRRRRRHRGRGVRARRRPRRRARSSATPGPSRRSSGSLVVGRAVALGPEPLALTDAGRRVLEGAEDHVALNGVERWIGGVHLVGREVPWRWDDGVEAVVASAGA